MVGDFRRPVLSEAVRKYIKRYILDNDLSPGDLLPSETELAEQLGVGRSSVREAMKALQSLGIVGVRRSQGFVVREWNLDPVLETLSYGIQFNKAAFTELLQIRIWLESSTVGTVLQHITPQDVAALDALMQEWHARFDRAVPWSELDAQFHEVLYQTLDNSTFVNLLHAFWRAFATVDETLTGVADIRVEYNAHNAILDAIKTGDETLTRDRLIKSFGNIHHRLKPTTNEEKRLVTGRKKP